MHKRTTRQMSCCSPNYRKLTKIRAFFVKVFEVVALEQTVAAAGALEDALVAEAGNDALEVAVADAEVLGRPR